jgi:dTDP-4-dehydrorhamnose 3,5-epimerase
MNMSSTSLPGLLIIEPQVFSDPRGSFMESFNARRFSELAGRDVHFVQDNESVSRRDVLRGLHYQMQHTQGKLVRVVQGRVLDVAVDLRRGSASFGQSFQVELSDENRRQVWVPEGFAHGFLVLSESATFLYKTTDYYHPASERCLLWSDPALAIDWGLGLDLAAPVLNAKDAQAPTLAQAIAAGDVFA